MLVFWGVVFKCKFPTEYWTPESLQVSHWLSQKDTFKKKCLLAIISPAITTNSSRIPSIEVTVTSSWTGWNMLEPKLFPVTTVDGSESLHHLSCLKPLSIIWLLEYLLHQLVSRISKSSINSITVSLNIHFLKPAQIMVVLFSTRLALFVSPLRLWWFNAW